MKRRRWKAFGCVVLLLSLVQVPLVKAADEVAGERDLGRVRKKVEALRAWQLTGELNLDEETSARLFPAMREADQERWRVESDNRALVRELSRTLKGQEPDPGKVNSILDELQSNRRKLVQIEERHLEKVRRILSPIDTARYLLFQIRFQREIKRKVAEAIGDRRRLDEEAARRNWDTMDDQDREDSGSESGGGSGGGGHGGGRR